MVFVEGNVRAPYATCNNLITIHNAGVEKNCTSHQSRVVGKVHCLPHCMYLFLNYEFINFWLGEKGEFTLAGVSCLRRWWWWWKEGKDNVTFALEKQLKSSRSRRELF